MSHMKQSVVLLTEDNLESARAASIGKSRRLFVSDFFIEKKKERKSRSLSPRKTWIKMNTDTTEFNCFTLLRLQNTVCLKRIFRRNVNAVIACIRWRSIVNIKKKTIGTTFKSNIKQIDELYSNVFNNIVQKWCKGITKKSLTSLKTPIQDYIKQPKTELQIDMAKIQLLNSIKFLTESLAYYTHPHYMSYELKGYLGSQFFKSYKNFQTSYVCQRTNYKENILDELPESQQSLISMEIIFYNLVYIIIETNSICNFSKIFLISSLHYLFKLEFDNMIIKKQIKEECLLFKILENNNILSINISKSRSVESTLIQNIYSDQQIIELFEFNQTQSNKIGSYFGLTIKHLEEVFRN